MFGNPKETCLNCKFNMNDHCNVGTHLAEIGKKCICYEGELWQVKVKYYSMFGNKKKLRIADAKLKLLAHKDLIRVSAFNKWWCDDTKPKEIYANSGIYLRTDKLGLDYMKDYWQFLSGLDDELMDEIYDEFYFIVISFHESVRKDWMKQLHG